MRHILKESLLSVDVSSLVHLNYSLLIDALNSDYLVSKLVPCEKDLPVCPLAEVPKHLILFK